jgi:GTPase
MLPGSDDIFESEIRKQVKLAIEEANVILFVVDCYDGLTDMDKEFANELRGSKKPIFIVANKADSPEKALLDCRILWLGYRRK